MTYNININTALTLSCYWQLINGDIPKSGTNRRQNGNLKLCIHLDLLFNTYLKKNLITLELNKKLFDHNCIAKLFAWTIHSDREKHKNFKRASKLNSNLVSTRNTLINSHALPLDNWSASLCHSTVYIWQLHAHYHFLLVPENKDKWAGMWHRQLDIISQLIGCYTLLGCTSMILVSAATISWPLNALVDAVDHRSQTPKIAHNFTQIHVLLT